MLESTESLLPLFSEGLKAVIVGEGPEALDELESLLGTLEVDVIARMEAAPRRVHPSTYVGSGKLEELSQFIESKKAKFAVLDFELSPNQLRNVEKILGCPVVDRPGVIIEIFSQHARTKEAKTQVELAKLQYLLPRLAHFWTHFERQRGGVGNRGMGEKQIEVDRRLVQTRMSRLKDRLASIEKERNVQRSGRQDVLKVALVGYTNAGKSTLLNALTASHVRSEDKLFATLDSSVRALSPDSHPPVVAIDTVGFISRLPHALVASFRSTLEELHEADLLLHVVDGSSEQAREHIQVTETVLDELGVGEKPRMTVLNKGDQIPADRRNNVRIVHPGADVVSAMNEEDVRLLREKILNHFKDQLEIWEIMVPYKESRLDAQIHAYGSIEISRPHQDGVFYRLRISEIWAKKLCLDRFRL